MKKQKGIFIGVLLTLLLSLSIGSLMANDSMQKKANTDISTWSSGSIEFILKETYALDATIKNYTTEEQLIQAYTKIDEVGQAKLLSAGANAAEVETSIKENQFLLAKEIMKLQKTYLKDSNIKYAILDQKTNQKLSNVDVDLFQIENDQAMQKQFGSYIMLSFDENGALILSENDSLDSYLWEWSGNNGVSKPLPVDFYVSEYYLYESVNEEGYVSESYEEKTLQIENPKSVSFVFALAKDIQPTGYFYNMVYQSGLSNECVGPVALMALCFAAIVALFMLCYPMRIIKECNPYKTLCKIKLELMVFFGGWILLMLFIGILWFTSSLVLDNNFYGGNIISEFQLTSDTISLICVALWMLFLFFISLFIYEIKLLIHVGLKRFIKEYTVIGWCYQKLVQLIQIDLNDEMNRTLLKIIILNFFIIIVVTFVFGVGLFFAFVYSIVLYVLLRDKFKSVQKDYQVILKATRRLSDGDFDVEIKENVGMFNTLRSAISNIKDGYKKAVKEEVKSQRMKTELISNVSHDLKTPLTSIITYVDLLKKEDVDETTRQQYLAVLDRNSIRLKQLIEDLFEVSKANTGNISLNIVDVDIVSLIKQAHFECSDSLASKQLDVRSNFDQEKIVCPLDSAKTYRVFENLFMNISKYALENTRVYIDVWVEKNQACITFKNISAHEMDFSGDEIVERFVQGDSSRNAKGSGLGLAIAKSFSEIQGGSFKVEVDGDLFKVLIMYQI